MLDLVFQFVKKDDSLIKDCTESSQESIDGQRKTAQLLASKQICLDSMIDSGFNVADSPSFAALVDQCQPVSKHTCVCIREQNHSRSCSTSSRTTLRAGEALVCALARCRAQGRNFARAWRAAPEQDFRACQPSPWISPGQNRSGE